VSMMGGEKGNAGKVFDEMLQRAAWSKLSVELSQGTARVSI
jgi:hypothetical protein